MKIIYVAGYGRSGSTLLDRSLGEFSGVTSLGEVALGSQASQDPAHSCSCGRPISECPIWGSVDLSSADLKEHLGVLLQEYLSGRVSREFSRTWAPILRSLEANPNCEDVVVDSSKTTYARSARPWLLERSGYRVVPIVIWRDPADVLESRAAARATRTGITSIAWTAAMEGVASWLIANVLGVVLVYRKKGVIVPFSALANRRDETMDSLRVVVERALDHEVGERIESTGHLVAGNRMRVAADGHGVERQSRPKLSSRQRLLTRAVTAPLRRYLSRNSLPVEGNL